MNYKAAKNIVVSVQN